MRRMALAAALATAAPAAADTPVPSRARELARQGRAYHDARDYAHAIAAFEEAYVLAPSPGLLFDLAQSYRLAGNCDDAAWMYKRYLDSDPDGDGRALAASHLRAVEQCRGGAHAEDAGPQSPGAADVTATATPDNAGHAERVAGVTLGTGGIALLAGATYFALQAHDASEDVSHAYAKGGKWQTIAAENARGEHDAQLGTVLGIAGGLAVAAGAVSYGLGWRAEHAKRFTVVPTPHGATATARWSW